MKLFAATIVGLLFLVTTAKAVVINNIKVNNNEELRRKQY